MDTSCFFRVVSLGAMFQLRSRKSHILAARAVARCCRWPVFVAFHMTGTGLDLYDILLALVLFSVSLAGLRRPMEPRWLDQATVGKHQVCF